MLKILIAEDEPLIAYALEETLAEAGYDVCGVACTVNEAVAIWELHKPELAVLDVRLKEDGRGPDISHLAEKAHLKSSIPPAMTRKASHSDPRMATQ